MPPDEAPLCGRSAILGWLRAQPRTTVHRIDIAGLLISGAGRFASKLATFRTTFEDPVDGIGVVTGTHAWLLQRNGAGEWHVAVVTWAIDGPYV
jgi:hypothetical protein